MADLLTDTGAQFSSCRGYRYRLWRRWDPTRVPLVMLMLNPSTADDVTNDPTVERCERRAKRLGHGSLEVLNIFAFRATEFADMKAATDPIGPENDAIIGQMFAAAALGRRLGMHPPTFCAGWGIHGAHLGRAARAAKMAEAAGVQLVCLGMTKEGQPRHPLYIANAAPFTPWPPSEAA